MVDLMVAALESWFVHSVPTLQVTCWRFFLQLTGASLFGHGLGDGLLRLGGMAMQYALKAWRKVQWLLHSLHTDLNSPIHIRLLFQCAWSFLDFAMQHQSC
jgi:hypothetical protein